MQLILVGGEREREEVLKGSCKKKTFQSVMELAPKS